MRLVSSILPILILLSPRRVTSISDSFHETLTLHPLPDGKLSILFEFTTYFSSHSTSPDSKHSHHSLTPPALLLPLARNGVEELTISFVSGQWDQRRSGESGGLSRQAGGGGGEVRGWLTNTSGKQRTDEAWMSVTHALGGLFCAGLGGEINDSVNTFGGIYPSSHHNTNHTHYYLSQPHLHLCTENLTPFLSLLPSKGLSGLSALLSKPSTVFSWGYKTEGIHVIMPGEDGLGMWKGWWEGVVDLVPAKGERYRDFSIRSLFGRDLPRGFPEAEESVIRLIMSKEGLRVDGGRLGSAWIDGRFREVVEWDLSEVEGKDLKFARDEEFRYPRVFQPPEITVSRTATDKYASEGTLRIAITNNGDKARQAVYSELWPWWVKGWMSEITLSQNGTQRGDLLQHFEYHPSHPPKVSSTTLHLTLVLPPKSTLILSIPFTKQTLKYTEHRPDAERGIEIPAGILTLLDADPARNQREKVYTSKLLLDVPTPDFSMPYNVIIMSCTVMAVFFGLMQGALTRRWGIVEVAVDVTKGLEQEKRLDGSRDGPEEGISQVSASG